VILPAVMLLALGLPARAEEPAEQLAQMKKDYAAVMKEHRAAVQATRTREDRLQAFTEWREARDKYLDRFLQFAEKNSEDGAAVDALQLVLDSSSSGAASGKETAWDRAMALVFRQHLQSDRLGELVSGLAYARDATSEKLLRAVVEKNPNREVKGLASFALGQFLMRQVQTIERLKHLDADGREAYEEYLGKETLKTLLARDPSALQKEAEGLFERIKKDFADVKEVAGDDPQLLGKRAENYLFEIRNLQVGMKAPELEGVDFEGKKVKLSDHRGKVVVLDVWATWCGPCVAMIPHERQLVRRLEGKPFVLLSIAVDEEKETVERFQRRNPMPWTHWFNGDKGGVLDAWNVNSFPTVYVIDARGVIRYKDVRDEQMDEAVEKLLKEMEDRTETK
jgi:thiol-disulfide isomerase/thioredoxin